MLRTDRKKRWGNHCIVDRDEGEFVMVSSDKLQDLLDGAEAQISYEFDEDSYELDVYGGVSITDDVIRSVFGDVVTDELKYEIADAIRDDVRVVGSYIKDVDDCYVGLQDIVHDWSVFLLDTGEIWIEVSVVDFHYDAAERITYLMGL